MLPLSDSPRARRTPWVNLSLILINICLFLYELGLGDGLEPFIETWGVVPARIDAALLGAPGADTGALVTLVTAMFLHGGLLHLGGNMLFLWIFGDNVEDRLGHVRYLLFYLISGVAANLAQVLVAPTSPIPAIGASGAIAGVLGAYFITYPGATVSVVLPLFFLFTVVDVPALIVIGLWFVTQFFSGITALADMSDQVGGVAWWAHVGGFLFGIVLMAIMPKEPRPSPTSWSVSFEQRAREETGLVGLLIGTISMVSQVVQLVILLRLVVVFLGVRFLAQVVPLVGELILVTTPLVRPFAFFIPPLRFAGHVIELYSIVAICAFYVIGAGLIWIVAALAYRPRRAIRRIGY